MFVRWQESLGSASEPTAPAHHLQQQPGDVTDDEVLQEMVISTNRSITELLTCMRHFQFRHSPLLLKTANLVEALQEELESLRVEAELGEELSLIHI